MIRLKRILVPTDFSEFSSVALRYGCEFAQQFEAELHVLNVVWYPLHSVVDLPPGHTEKSYADYEKELRETAEQQLRNLCVDPLTDPDRVKFVTQGGSPIVEIVRYSRTNEIDLIVLGTHGLTGLKHLLMGSVAENVVRKSTCPVLTVRHPEHEFVMP